MSKHNIGDMVYNPHYDSLGTIKEITKRSRNVVYKVQWFKEEEMLDYEREYQFHTEYQIDAFKVALECTR